MTRRASLLLAACLALGAGTPVRATEPGPTVSVGTLADVLAAARAPGARAVLVNVWATWCDPCREELPELIRFYRDRRAAGLRLVLVSADDPQDRDKVAAVLAAAGLPAGTPSFVKEGDDMKFINGLDRRWGGALPASFLFDGRGHERHWWGGPVTYRALDRAVAPLLPNPNETGRSRP